MLVTDRHVLIYQTVITDLRQSLGRIATIYLEPTKVLCAYCILDPVHGKVLVYGLRVLIGQRILAMYHPIMIRYAQSV